MIISLIHTSHPYGLHDELHDGLHDGTVTVEEQPGESLKINIMETVGILGPDAMDLNGDRGPARHHGP